MGYTFFPYLPATAFLLVRLASFSCMSFFPRVLDVAVHGLDAVLHYYLLLLFQGVHLVCLFFFKFLRGVVHRGRAFLPVFFAEPLPVGALSPDELPIAEAT